ncbi:MAG TPA: alkaline phosphatase PhoX [Kofleriaceae bacterium]|nr:alkaline phosphatase PhoX [Kofleriaceae bacterium]
MSHRAQRTIERTIDPIPRRIPRIRRLAAILGAVMVVAACSGEDGEPGPKGDQGEPGQDGTGGGGAGAAGNLLSFTPVAVPVTDDEKRAVIASPEALVGGDLVPLSYVVEARSGDAIGDAVFGRIVDQDGNPVTNEDGSEFVSPSNDSSTIHQVGDKLFEVTHFETQPAAMYVSELAQDESGKLSITSTRPVDFSGVHGLWNPCAGSVTPWNTHLGGEEYPQDARASEAATTAAELTGTFNANLLRYFGLDPATATLAEAQAVFSPYYYGYPVEVAVDEAGATTVTKHYAMGRHAVELGYVMPDQKTVYITDDGTNDSLQMFVAARPGDLSEGRLYAARWFQTSPPGQGHGSADIYWIELGTSAKAADVEALVDGGIVFSDIFDTGVMTGTGTCPANFTAVNVDSAAPGECLRLKKGMELAASRLENRRYAAYLGATTEFRKLEGITYNEAGHRLYVSFSELNGGTEDAEPAKDLGGPNHIRLAANDCGAVFEFVITKDATIGSDFVAESAKSLVEGTWLADPANPNPYPDGSPYAGKNECAVTTVSNPDNLSFAPGYSTLFIGEDSGSEHQNDSVWAYNVQTGELDRILTTPYGAETTGVYFYPDVGGHAYIKAQVQHPFGESDQDQMKSADELRSYTGYIGPLPKMN